MNVKLRMYNYCYSNLGAIYAKGLLGPVFNMVPSCFIHRLRYAIVILI